jgi:protein-tyrosine phosphatase
MPAGCRNLLDEVYPGIFVGDRHAAQKTDFLKRVGITHILNAAEGTRVRTVNTGKDYYTSSNIEYLGLELLDNETEVISQYLHPALQFIYKAVDIDQGKVLVHCEMGISRSSTFVIAYLMWKEKMNLIEAVKKVREKRDVRPNSGFLKQLVLYEMNLAKLEGCQA